MSPYPSHLLLSFFGLCWLPLIAVGDDLEVPIENHPEYRRHFRQAAACLIEEEWKSVASLNEPGSRTSTVYFPKVFLHNEGEGDPWVLWLEGNEIILFEAYRIDLAGFRDLARSRRRLNLTRDVVENPEDVGTSTYLVYRPWEN